MMISLHILSHCEEQDRRRAKHNEVDAISMHVFSSKNIMHLSNHINSYPFILSISSNPSKLLCKSDPFFLSFLSTFWCVAFQRCKRLLPPSRNRFQSGTHLNQHRRKSWKNGGKLGRDHFKIVCSWEMSRMHRRRHGRSMGCRIDFCFTFLYPVFRLASRRSSCRIPWRLTTFANGFSENGNHFMWKSDFRSQRFDFFSKNENGIYFLRKGWKGIFTKLLQLLATLGPI